MKAIMSQQAIRAGLLSPRPAAATAFGVLVAISYAHFSNDLLQSLLPAIYPNLKLSLGLTFAQIGFVTLAYQITASLLQPAVGLFSDKRPTPVALPLGTLFAMGGLCVLAAAHNYGMLVSGACLLGVSSAIFHPEASRVARMASGGQPGLAQSLFQVGGNFGSALGPLAAALIVVRFGQTSLVFFAMFSLFAFAVLWFIAQWYRAEGLTRLKAAAKRHPLDVTLPHRQVVTAIVILLVLIFSKYFYLVSITNYLTFYLIEEVRRVGAKPSALHLFMFVVRQWHGPGTIAGRIVTRRPLRPQIHHLVFDLGHAAVHLAAAARQFVLDRPAHDDHRLDPCLGVPGDRGVCARTGARQNRYGLGHVLRIRVRDGGPRCCHPRLTRRSRRHRVRLRHLQQFLPAIWTLQARDWYRKSNERRRDS